ncbi:MAG: 16S rRNA (uracil(1498)-N(3))-methyltransferase [Pseudomonadota bacterium]|nr:16S rRNA (uracil(1498)-N(3))-methyltransferase [Pseudomonadota bacterium]
MNLLLLDSLELSPDNCTTLCGRRAEHICNTLNAQVGNSLSAGIINGEYGNAEITHINTEKKEVSLHFTPNKKKSQQQSPTTLPVTMIIALPRPKVAKRLIAVCAECGVKELHFINSFRVEKSFWQSPQLNTENIQQQLLLGLEQSKDTALPVVSLHSKFKPFVEDKLAAIRGNKDCFVAHPYNADLTLNNLNDRATIGASGHVVIIGPEGGFIPYEVALLQENACQTLSMGPRIYRVETVVPMLIALFGNSSIS